MTLGRFFLGCVALATMAWFASPAQAAVIPRDGTYAAMDLGTGAMALFVMREQIVAGVEYQIPITCVDSDGNTQSDFFKGGGEFPANTRLGTNLRLMRNYMEKDEGLSGRELGVQVKIDFSGNKPKMTVWANRGTSLPCDGSTTLSLKRGPLPSGTQCSYNAARRTFTCD